MTRDTGVASRSFGTCSEYAQDAPCSAPERCMLHVQPCVLATTDLHHEGLRCLRNIFKNLPKDLLRTYTPQYSIAHFAADCTVAIYLDVPKALAMGIKLFRSSNDVAPRQPNFLPMHKVLSRLHPFEVQGAW